MIQHHEHGQHLEGTLVNCSNNLLLEKFGKIIFVEAKSMDELFDNLNNDSMFNIDLYVT